jgi:uncharacterized protein (DUF697 family)
VTIYQTVSYTGSFSMIVLCHAPHSLEFRVRATPITIADAKLILPVAVGMVVRIGWFVGRRCGYIDRQHLGITEILDGSEAAIGRRRVRQGL